MFEVLIPDICPQNEGKCCTCCTPWGIIIDNHFLFVSIRIIGSLMFYPTSSVKREEDINMDALQIDNRQGDRRSMHLKENWKNYKVVGNTIVFTCTLNCFLLYRIENSCQTFGAKIENLSSGSYLVNKEFLCVVSSIVRSDGVLSKWLHCSSPG